MIDMPPGTGDTQLSVSQSIPIAGKNTISFQDAVHSHLISQQHKLHRYVFLFTSGAVIVSTPQDLALIDARRAVGMFNKVNIPILGIVQNMSTFICPHCSKASHIFGHSGAEQMARDMNVDLLGIMPIPHLFSRFILKIIRIFLFSFLPSQVTFRWILIFVSFQIPESRS